LPQLTCEQHHASAHLSTPKHRTVLLSRHIYGQILTMAVSCCMLASPPGQHHHCCVMSCMQARLLHAGAATQDIITTYVSCIKALRDIDPSGAGMALAVSGIASGPGAGSRIGRPAWCCRHHASRSMAVSGAGMTLHMLTCRVPLLPAGALLDAVSEPIRGYLRSRSDTIRCIVSMLTGEGAEGGETLLEELAASGGLAGGWLGGWACRRVGWEGRGLLAAMALLRREGRHPHRHLKPMPACCRPGSGRQRCRQQRGRRRLHRGRG
jgi:hypothetical protein